MLSCQSRFRGLSAELGGRTPARVVNALPNQARAGRRAPRSVHSSVLLDDRLDRLAPGFVHRSSSTGSNRCSRAVAPGQALVLTGQGLGALRDHDLDRLHDLVGSEA